MLKSFGIMFTHAVAVTIGYKTGLYVWSKIQPKLK